MTTKVLVVDDELDTLNLLRVLLELTGFEPVTTLNSTEAITLAEIEKVDVALLDIMMPKLDGFQLCRMMREHSTLKDLPIIFVTAYDALDLEDRRKEVGADHVVHKPINIDMLTTIITDIQQKRLVAQTNHVTPAAPKPETDASKASITEKPVAAPKPAPEAKPEVADKPAAAPKAEAPAKPDPSSAPKVPETPKPESAPMPMTFVSASSDDADDTKTMPPPSVAETATPADPPKSEEPAKPATTGPSSVGADASPKDDSGNEGSSKTDTTPIKPHRPPTPQ